jgi:hypothetical protein
VIQQATESMSQLYELDETAWLEAMAELIVQGRCEELDYPHLGEFLTDMALRERREVKTRLTTLLMHVLKWTHQPDQRSRSWRGTITEQRHELLEQTEYGVLRNHAQAIIGDAYRKAVERAADETGLPAGSFPAECPYTLDQLLSPDVLAE